MSEGKALRLYLRTNDITTKHVVSKLKISRPTLNNWFKKDVLKGVVLEKLKLLNIKKSDFVNMGKNLNDNKTLIKENESLKKENALLWDLVEQLKKK